MTDQIKIFGTADERTRGQIERCGEHAAFAVLCADNHVGYSQPIGGALAFEDKISPSGVGYRRTRRRKTFTCTAPGCAHAAASRDDAGPEHPGAALRKGWVTERLSPGRSTGTPCGPSCAPTGSSCAVPGPTRRRASTRLWDVLAAHGETIEIRHVLTPIGVAMAGAEVFDPYED